MILQQINEAISNFKQDTGRLPEGILLGEKEYGQFKAATDWMTTVSSTMLAPTIYGITFYKVDAETLIKVI